MALSASLLAALLSIFPGPVAGPATSNRSAEAPMPDFGQWPLQFEANAGQTSPDVSFLSHTPGGTFFFTSSGVLLSLFTEANQGKGNANFGAGDNSESQQANVAFAAEEETQPEVVSLAFPGANPNVIISGNAVLPGRVNYFIGDDPTRWHTNLSSYGEVTYAGLYPGIDLTYGGLAGRLKGTYAVAPGASPALNWWR